MKSQRMIPLTSYEHRRYDRLLEATDHIAPRIKFSDRRFDDQRYLDSLTVIQDYNRGYRLFDVTWDEICRLA